MRATSKFLIAIGAAALVTAATSAGASAAPLQPRISTDGLSEINLPPDLISSFAADGVAITANAGAKATESKAQTTFGLRAQRIGQGEASGLNINFHLGLLRLFLCVDAPILRGSD